MTSKIPHSRLGAQDDQAFPLVVRCVTPVLHFFRDLHADVNATRRMFQANSNLIEFQPITNGFLLQVETLSALQDACARLWQIDVTASTGVREFGLWDIEVLKNANNEDLSRLIRSVYLLCEKVVSRKKPEACKSMSD